MTLVDPKRQGNCNDNVLIPCRTQNKIFAGCFSTTRCNVRSSDIVTRIHPIIRPLQLIVDDINDYTRRDADVPRAAEIRCDVPRCRCRDADAAPRRASADGADAPYVYVYDKTTTSSNFSLCRVAIVDLVRFG